MTANVNSMENCCVMFVSLMQDLVEQFSRGLGCMLSMVPQMRK
jgi:hypothetical protein